MEGGRHSHPSYQEVLLAPRQLLKSGSKPTLVSFALLHGQAGGAPLLQLRGRDEAGCAVGVLLRLPPVVVVL